jgi:hypothetical protein
MRYYTLQVESCTAGLRGPMVIECQSVAENSLLVAAGMSAAQKKIVPY